MRLSSHVTLTRQTPTRLNSPGWGCLICRFHSEPRCRSLRWSPQRKHFSSSSALRAERKEKTRDVAILGGGITGLASAYYLAKADPKAKITLYEASRRLGGWIQSKHVDVHGDGGSKGRVLFESGPRTLRPSGNGAFTAHLMQELGLMDDMLWVPKTSPAARNRYVYWPDHLVKLPGPGMGLFGLLAGVFRDPELYLGVLNGALSELWGSIRGTIRPKGQDESVGDFISRRSNKEVADNLASAVFHGIYAGDIYDLSVRSLLPTAAYLETQHGGVLLGIIRLKQLHRKLAQRAVLHPRQVETMRSISPDVGRNLAQCSVFTLINGLGQLVSHMEEAVKELGITVKRSTAVTSIKRALGSTDKRRPIWLTTSSGEERPYDTVVSTVPYNALNRLISAGTGSQPQGFRQPSVDVMVVNLFFSDPKLLAANPGFGYLIPRSVSFEQNPEFALGVIFDTFAAPGQDTATGTKLTVMLGGHWWKGRKELPTEEEGVELARSVIARHLRISEEPVASQARLQRQCIPQYTVGHWTRMRGFGERLMREFDGRLRVAGCSYSQVGVNDCIRAAFDIAAEVKEKGWTTQVTGLEQYLLDTPMIEMQRMALNDLPAEVLAKMKSQASGKR